MRLQRIISLTATMVFFSFKSVADDWRGAFERRAGLPSYVIAKLEELDHYREFLAKQAAMADRSSGLEGLVQRFLLWPSGKITVCFMDGVPEQWHKVVSVANEWTAGTTVHFDFANTDEALACGSKNVADIRVRLRGRASWSEVGTKAKYIPPEYPTMQLSGVSFDAAIQSAERRTILHEFGHALGFEHEHQNVNGGCQEEFNWEYLYSTLGSKEQVDRNMAQIGKGTSITGVYASQFDRESIMIYSLPPVAFKQGASSKCYVTTPPDRLSKIDTETVLAVYGRDENLSLVK